MLLNFFTIFICFICEIKFIYLGVLGELGTIFYDFIDEVREEQRKGEISDKQWEVFDKQYAQLTGDCYKQFEKELTAQFGADQKYSFEERNGIIIKQYSSAFTIAFDKKMEGMIERRMRQSIFAVASFWYTAWVNAGQPDLKSLSKQQFSTTDAKEFEELNSQWQSGGKMLGKQEE